MSRLQTPFSDLLGVRLAIVQAPTAGVNTPELVRTLVAEVDQAAR